MSDDCEIHGKVVRESYDKCPGCMFEEDFLTSEQWKEEADKASEKKDFLTAHLYRHAYMTTLWGERHPPKEFKFGWGDRLIEKATGKRCRVVGSSVSYGRGGVAKNAILKLWFLERDEDGAMYLERRELIEDELEEDRHKGARAVDWRFVKQGLDPVFFCPVCDGDLLPEGGERDEDGRWIYGTIVSRCESCGWSDERKAEPWDPSPYLVADKNPE